MPRSSDPKGTIRPRGLQFPPSQGQGRPTPWPRHGRAGGEGLASLFQGATLSDERLWESVEDALISADVGVETSLGVVNAVRQRVREEGVSDADEVVELFKEELAFLLDRRTRVSGTGTTRSSWPQGLSC